MDLRRDSDIALIAALFTGDALLVYNLHLGRIND